MKFLITSGRKKGTIFELLDKEIRLGRKKDNQVVLDDESVSGYHARICMKGDEAVVEDCDSVNGIEVNGAPTKKATLHPKDVIAIGMTQITVLEGEDESEEEKEKGKTEEKKADKKKEKEEADEEEPAADRPSKDKKGRKPAKEPSHAGKTIAAILLVVLVIVFAAALFIFPNKMRTSPSRSSRGSELSGDYAKTVFRLRYERVEASSKDIFRYEMSIVNGTLSVAIDDIKQEKHIRKNKALEPKAIARIHDSIQEQQIFSLPAQIEGKTTDVWDSNIMEVVADGQSHRIQVLNRLPPDNFKKVCTQLADFAAKELNMIGETMTSEELKKRAQEGYQRACQLSEQRSVKAENLYNAIKAFDEVIWYLESIEPKPPIYADAIKGRQEAVDALGKQIEDHRFRATKAIQLKEWKTAAMELRQLLEKLPDQTDKRNQDAQVQLLDVERHLQTR
jgi:hypothetical protein